MSKPVLSDEKFQLLMETRKQLYETIPNLLNYYVSVDFGYFLGKLVCEQVELHNLPFVPDPSKGLPETAEIIINLLTDRQIYGAAFAFSVLINYWKDPDTLKKEHLNRAIALRKKIQGDMAKYKQELQSFEECFLKVYGLRNFTFEMVFPVLDMMLDEMIFNVKEKSNEVEFAEQFWMLARKRFDLKFAFCNGTNASLVLMEMSMLLFLGIYRFKQARYILSIFAHLIKNTGKKDKEHFDKLERLYLSYLLQTSDILRSFKISTAQAKYFEFDDKLIPCDINLPGGEDMELPIRPLVTDAEFNDAEKKVQEYFRNSIFLLKFFESFSMLNMNM